MVSVGTRPVMSRGLSEQTWFPAQQLALGTAESEPTASDEVLAEEARAGTGARVIVTQSGTAHAPAWVAPVAQRAEHLLALRSGWAGPGSRAVGLPFVVSAIHPLAGAMDRETPAPSIVPMNNGTVQIEWHRSGIDLEVELLTPTSFAVTYQDQRAGEEWERVVTDAVHALRAPLRLLAERG
jgi:hypothetical protein